MVLLLVVSSASATVLQSSLLPSARSSVISASADSTVRVNNLLNSLFISGYPWCSLSILSHHGKTRTNCCINNFSVDWINHQSIRSVYTGFFKLARQIPHFLLNANFTERAEYQNRNREKVIDFQSDASLQQQLSSSEWNQSAGKYQGHTSSGLDIPPQVPLPPFTGGFISLLGLLLVIGVILDRWIWGTSKKVNASDTGSVPWGDAVPQLSSTGIARFLRRDLRTKESVEWVNMVLGKLWKVYRVGLEDWLVGLLQPLIDNLQKPAYVERVQIKQFYLGDEPISVRSVQRRASRRSNDLQYHIGLRYTGGARMLLLLKLKAGILPLTIPVGVRDLDVDGELWVKLRLVPSQPWVGAATWAFVSLPKIKLDLSPFRLFNLMAIPFLSVFLTKLLAEDLPRLFVLPKKISIDFLKGRSIGLTPKDFKGMTVEGNKEFSGELSVTLIDARKLIFSPYGKSDPYVVFRLGDQVIKSKRNNQTSVFGPPGSPIWNQDFHILVVDPKTQRLSVRVRDYFGFSTITVGVGEVDLSPLQDTVPVDQVVRLKGSWGPLKKRFVGELMLRLTYTAYVEEDEDEDEAENENDFTNANKNEDAAIFTSRIGYLTDADESDAESVPLLKEMVNKAVDSAESENSLSNVFAAVIAELNNEDMEDALSNRKNNRGISFPDDSSNVGSKDSGIVSGEGDRQETSLLWLGFVTAVIVLVDSSINFSNFLNP
ncbi:hypothetical protein KP509_23G031200 [Ceratopteris richardii]|uniref:Uncharacterized protein n=1 Tax=Ceratopteris richardii TaxID=49495 RepID=A0A8T2RYN2_CERRI|nr:hypothetical protein KP509_23G031200 [Ceratopteris richardii]KAH7301541.1 hypothetical protein KP509_23G031200 [Ceratopteris richardii]